MLIWREIFTWSEFMITIVIFYNTGLHQERAYTYSGILLICQALFIVIPSRVSRRGYNTTFKPNIKQNRGKIHSLKNVVCYRKDKAAGTQFLPSPCDLRKVCHLIET